MTDPEVRLRRKRADVLIHYRHPWVFSNGLLDRPQLEAGTQVRVCDDKGKLLGRAFYHPNNPICLRMIAFGDEDPPDWSARLARAYALRRSVLDESTCYRLVHGENDGFPGLTIDIFDKLACIQVTSSGFESVKTQLVQPLMELTGVTAVFERSEGHARKREGLPSAVGFLAGEVDLPVEIRENGLSFQINPLTDHKTGFYLDQRAQRAFVAAHAKGLQVLDLCCYTGGFTMAALAGGAAHVHAIDTSNHVLEGLAANLERNGLKDSSYELEQADIFTWLTQPHQAKWDMVILDPPSLAKTVKAAEKAQKGYRKINHGAAKLVKPGGSLLTFSCTGVVSRDVFNRAVFFGNP